MIAKYFPELSNFHISNIHFGNQHYYYSPLANMLGVIRSIYPRLDSSDSYTPYQSMNLLLYPLSLALSHFLSFKHENRNKRVNYFYLNIKRPSTSCTFYAASRMELYVFLLHTVKRNKNNFQIELLITLCGSTEQQTE